VSHLDALLLLVSVVAAAGPLDKVFAGLKSRSPSLLEQIVVFELNFFLHVNFLLQGRLIKIERAVSKESFPLFGLVWVITLDLEALGLLASLKNCVLFSLDFFRIGLLSILLSDTKTLLDHSFEAAVEDFIADLTGHLVLKLFLVQHDLFDY
jgi:hypothetical protein